MRLKLLLASCSEQGRRDMGVGQILQWISERKEGTSRDSVRVGGVSIQIIARKTSSLMKIGLDTLIALWDVRISPAFPNVIRNSEDDVHPKIGG